MKRALLASLVPAVMFSAAADAQTLDTLDRRLNRVEKEVRAVQRKVFPGGDERFFEPEIDTSQPGVQGDTIGVPAATPSTVFTERLNALEEQVQGLTSQIEENSFRLRQLETRLEAFESDTKFRLTSLEGGGLSGETGDGDEAAPAGDDVTATYEAAYALYQDRDFAGAQAALSTFIEEHPDHNRASAAGYWLGRSLLAQDQPVQAVQAFLSNYQERRDGTRAPDSLLWVGRALMQIEPPRTAQACQAYDRLEDEYEGRMSDEVTSGLIEARLEAECT